MTLYPGIRYNSSTINDLTAIFTIKILVYGQM